MTSPEMDDFDRATMELRIAGGKIRDDRRSCAAFLAGFAMSTPENFGAATAHIEDEAWFEGMARGFDAWWERETVANPRNRWSQFSDDELGSMAGDIGMGHAEYSLMDGEPDTHLIDEIYAEVERRKA